MKKIFFVSLILCSLVFPVPPRLEIIIPPTYGQLLLSSESFVDSTVSPPRGYRFLKEPLLVTNCTTSVHVYIRSCDSIWFNYYHLNICLLRSYIRLDSSNPYPVIASWDHNSGEPPSYCPPGWWTRGNQPPINFWMLTDSNRAFLDTFDRGTGKLTLCNNMRINRVDSCLFELVFPTVNCVLCSVYTDSRRILCRRDWPYFWIESNKNYRPHFGINCPQDFYLGPICNPDTECIRPGPFHDLLMPPLSFSYSWGRVIFNFPPPFPRVIAVDGFPSGTLSTFPESIYIDICSGGCGLPMPTGYPFDSSFHFLLDSSQVEMIITWYGGEDTVESFSSPGSFWFKPATRPLPWRRFGVLVDSTSLPRAYTGPVRVCLMDVTNSPVIKFGPPVHLHPVGVYPFDTLVVIRPESVKVIGGDTIIFPADTVIYPGCVPKPAEPVCWNFYTTSGVTQREETALPEIFVSFSDGQIVVSGQLPINGRLELYDITGKVVLRRTITAKGSEKIGIDKLNSGVYFIRVVNGKRSVVRKVLVVR